jgi:predicted RNase H-like nuclease
MFVAGVDGCKKGWLAVKLTDKNSWEPRIFLSINDLWEYHSRASLILIDIPIGLIEAGPLERDCDILARWVLGPRKFSVFPAPRRKLLESKFLSYQEANKKNRQIAGGKGISQQSYAILPKIIEVDHLLRTEASARQIIREVHPEVCFWALAGGRPMRVNKKEADGFAERREVLKDTYPPCDKIIAEGICWLQGKGVSPDDLLDALAAAVTGLLGGTELQTLPPSPDRDAWGLPMEMVYFVPDS